MFALLGASSAGWLLPDTLGERTNLSALVSFTSSIMSYRGITVILRLFHNQLFTTKQNQKLIFSEYLVILCMKREILVYKLHLHSGAPQQQSVNCVIKRMGWDYYLGRILAVNQHLNFLHPWRCTAPSQQEEKMQAKGKGQIRQNQQEEKKRLEMSNHTKDKPAQWASVSSPRTWKYWVHTLLISLY